MRVENSDDGSVEELFCPTAPASLLPLQQGRQKDKQDKQRGDDILIV